MLSGCLHLQLFGSVGGATVTIAPILDRDNIVYQSTSTGVDSSIVIYGQETWDDWGPLLQMFFVGLLNTNQNTDLDDEELYLVIATGGLDYDASDSDRLLDATGTPVFGSFHAILTGAQIKGNLGKVSVLTEALYQAMDPATLDNHSKQWFIDELDLFSDRFVGDINGDGLINYEDVLSWSRIWNPEDHIGDRALLDQLSQAVINGESDQTLFDLAQALMASGIDTEHPLAGSWTLEVAAGELICTDDSVTTLAAFSENVTVSISGATISFPASDWSSIPDWEITGDSGISGSFNNDQFVANQTLTGVPLVNPDLGEQSIAVTYSGQFDGNNWSGSYDYSFSIEGFDFNCESTQAFSGSKLD
ncbi:MAG: hypothetical protein ABJ308_04240 [Halieaceae bacterium]